MQKLGSAARGTRQQTFSIPATTPLWMLSQVPGDVTDGLWRDVCAAMLRWNIRPQYDREQRLLWRHVQNRENRPYMYM